MRTDEKKSLSAQGGTFLRSVQIRNSVRRNIVVTRNGECLLRNVTFLSVFLSFARGLCAHHCRYIRVMHREHSRMCIQPPIYRYHYSEVGTLERVNGSESSAAREFPVYVGVVLEKCFSMNRESVSASSVSVFP